MNPEISIDFVRNRGNPLTHARLAYLLYGDPAPNYVLSMLVDGQRPDGGWPPTWSSNYSSLDATCFRFAQAQQLGLTAANVALARGCAFVSQRQHNDGSWEEAEEQAMAAPDWVKPGRRSARLYLTANCGFWLAVLHGNQSGVLMAARYLQAHIGKGNGLPSYMHSQWLAAGLFYRLKWFEYAESLLAFIEGRLEILPVSNLAWMMLTLIIAGLPCDHQLITKGISILEMKQNRDGSWLGDGSPLGDIHTTLEVLYVLRTCSRY